jgi:hypothetical protein
LVCLDAQMVMPRVTSTKTVNSVSESAWSLIRPPP